MKYLIVVVRDQNGRKLLEHPCPVREGRITLTVTVPELEGGLTQLAADWAVCDCPDPVINEKYNFCSRCSLPTRPAAKA